MMTSKSALSARGLQDDKTVETAIVVKITRYRGVTDRDKSFITSRVYTDSESLMWVRTGVFRVSPNNGSQHNKACDTTRKGPSQKMTWALKENAEREGQLFSPVNIDKSERQCKYFIRRVHCSSMRAFCLPWWRPIDQHTSAKSH